MILLQTTRYFYFNSKLGKKREGETSLGSFSKGTRNDNGESRVKFCEKINKLFSTYTAFKKASRHTTRLLGNTKTKTIQTVE